MPAGQFYPGQKLVEESVVQDALLTYTQGLASKTVNPVTPAFAGSGTAVTNTFGYNVNVYLFSTTAGTITSVQINGGTVSSGNFPGQYFLKPNDTITPTFVGTGTSVIWVWQAE